MTTTETPTRTPRTAIALYYATYIGVLGIIAVALFLAWPALVYEIQARMDGAPAPPLQSTAAVARPPVHPARPIVAPALPGVAQNEAEAQSMYDAAVKEAELAVPNVNPAPAPAQLVTKPSAREGAGDVVPTSLPLPQAESGGIFGSKPAVVNPQETHECKHGQVWAEGRGCKNPTPEK